MTTEPPKLTIEDRISGIDSWIVELCKRLRDPFRRKAALRRIDALLDDRIQLMRQR